jgi:hypothetical protein
MDVNPHYAERELPVLHEMIGAAPFGLLVFSVIRGLRECGRDDDRALGEAMTEDPYVFQEPRGDR